MGDRQSMVVLNWGDWVEIDGYVWVVGMQEEKGGRVFIERRLGDSLEVVRRWVRLTDDITKLPKELYPILSDSILFKEDI